MKHFVALTSFVFILSGCGSDYEEPEEVVIPPPPVQVFTPSQTYEITLNGKQQVPRNNTDTSATAVIEVDESLNLFTIDIDTTNLSDIDAAHIHVGSIGVNGDVLFALEPNGDSSYVLDETSIDDDTIAQLAAGNFYLNIHTDAFPNGEVRGQIVTADTTILLFDLSGQQEVPAVQTTASGDGYATHDAATGSTDVVLRTTGVPDATAAHIHTGRVGMNGEVLTAFEQSTDDENIWIINDLIITEDTFDVLASGGHYVNVHTPAVASGELRGQILTDNFVLAAFDLSGQQEVPAVQTTASGSGYALIDKNDFSLEVKVLTSGVPDATAAHIHTGRVGMNGSVLAAFDKSMDNANLWMIDDLTITQDILDVLASGGHYVNVHTPAVASGELRGQILTDNFVLAAFDLSGQQEVPAVQTTASGSGYALIDTNDLSLEVKVLTSGVPDATAAHIHTGRVGMNGSVLAAFDKSLDNTNLWMINDLTITPEIFDVLASGGHYVNVHTPAVASGELRGQILTDNFVLAAFDLSGQQEVPAVQTTASGSGYALIDTNDLSLEIKVLTAGVPNATAAHIHTGRVGMNGGVLTGLEQSMDDINLWMINDLTITPEIFDVLASGGHYVNVHTPAVASGELRGQILTDNFVLAAFDLSGQQEVPAVQTTASGSGYALIDTSDLSLEIKVLTAGVPNATAAHIHTGRVGMNGSVLAAFDKSMDNANLWMINDLTITQDTFDVLASGGHYVNVHTPAVASGELRGQIISNNYTLITFGLDGSQQVPSNSSTASGDGYALVDRTSLDTELTIHTREVDDATAAHIHSGVRGENGSVLVALVKDTDEANVWSTPSNFVLTNDDVDAFLNAGHYVNVHTPAFTMGEIRGQIE